jgi:hypothetical protein
LPFTPVYGLTINNVRGIALIVITEYSPAKALSGAKHKMIIRCHPPPLLHSGGVSVGTSGGLHQLLPEFSLEQSKNVSGPNKPSLPGGRPWGERILDQQVIGVAYTSKLCHFGHAEIGSTD